MKGIWQKLERWLTKNREGRRNFAIMLLVAFAMGLFFAFLVARVAQRQEEAKYNYFPITRIDDNTEDPALWGQNFPYQYALYLKTADMVRTRYGGSEVLRRLPSASDPRLTVAQSKLEEDPRYKILWAGYSFAIDAREERGHAYMLTDQLYTQRQKAGQRGNCANCHASVYVVYKILGQGDIMAGFHKLNALPYSEAKTYLKHPVACIDCHNPTDMSLRITRPAFMLGIAAYMAKRGIKNYNVNQDASRREMRTYVCAQCHVEYYFKGTEKTLTYPWDEGLKAEEILLYYDKVNHRDWLHAETGAAVLKAQHPEFEVYQQGIHARAGVTCVDCHMPFEKVGNIKITNHHVRSPYLNVRASCGHCHPLTEEELKSRIETIQDRHNEMRQVAFEALINFIQDFKGKMKNLTPHQIEKAQTWQRKAQFFFDFIEAENSMGFHAPQESMRILMLSLEATRQGQLAIHTKP
ncbi:MAG: ammonia-forming cytochrome c nitrite reductase subunit c552 [Leptospiraceae bacterium]|nr:ammonia-forming cytochrome c nitrite reductase subunit c552 [Leptospiraceae bacterium]MDW8306497.1 ammonia-forming cytochrome c nitrite reductase subunit c552 [Leptospiraceae bacterium]